VKRQHGPRSGEIATWYPRINAMMMRLSTQNLTEFQVQRTVEGLQVRRTVE
jgi:hypothetical protein